MVFISVHRYVEFHRYAVADGKIGKREARLRIVGGEAHAVDLHAARREGRPRGNGIGKHEVAFQKRACVGDNGSIVEGVALDGVSFIHRLHVGDPVGDDLNGNGIRVFREIYVAPDRVVHRIVERGDRLPEQHLIAR